MLVSIAFSEPLMSLTHSQGIIGKFLKGDNGPGQILTPNEMALLMPSEDIKDTLYLRKSNSATLKLI